MLTRSLPVSQLLTVTFLLALSAAIVIHPINNYDIFWHLANGREMLARGYIVNTEIFSYTFAGTHFNNHEWLSQVLFYLVHELSGWAGLIWFKVLLTLGVAGFVYSAIRHFNVNPVLAGTFVVWVVVAGYSRYIIRPHLFSMLLLSMLVWVVFGYMQGRLGKKYLWVIPPLMLVWDLLHGAVYGVAFLLMVFAGILVRDQLGKRFPGWEGANPTIKVNSRPFFIVLLVALVLMLISPYGLRSYDVFLMFFDRTNMAFTVNEFEPTPIMQPLAWAFWAMIGFGIGVLAIAPRRVDVVHWVVFAGFAVLGVLFSRAVAVFSIVAAPILASQFAWLLSHLRKLAATLVMATMVVFVVGWGIVQKFKFAYEGTASYGLGVNAYYLPLASIDFIKDQGLQGNLYNSNRFGGLLAWMLAPERKIFHYNHHAIFGDPNRYLRDPGSMDQHQVQYALVGSREEMMALFPSSQWAIVYSEPEASVVVRRTPQHEALIRKFEIRRFHPLTPANQLVSMARGMRSVAQLAKDVVNYLSYRHDPAIAAALADILGLLDEEEINADILSGLQKTKEKHPDHMELSTAIDELYLRADYRH